MSFENSIGDQTQGMDIPPPEDLEMAAPPLVDVTPNQEGLQTRLEAVHDKCDRLLDIITGDYSEAVRLGAQDSLERLEKERDELRKKLNIPVKPRCGAGPSTMVTTPAPQTFRMPFQALPPDNEALLTALAHQNRLNERLNEV